MENITIIATIKDKENNKSISDEQFLLEAKQYGKVYTLSEFERAFNNSEICSRSVLVRVLDHPKITFSYF